MNIKILLSFLFCSATIVTAVAQAETNPVQLRNHDSGEVEEFNVLKSDNHVRQGPYVRYRQTVSIVEKTSLITLFETGNYELGRKEGEWRTFSAVKPWNKLISKGNYHDGKQEGVWTYYQLFTPAGMPMVKAVATDATSKSGYAVSISDTTAVIQAQGLYTQGMRVGVWTYFNRQGEVIQKVDHFTNRLLYWRPAANPILGTEVLTTHPVLYVGGKDQLTAEIFKSIKLNFMSILGAAKNGEVELVFKVDESGHQIGLAVANTDSPSRYEKILLATLAKVPALWVPQVVDGKTQASEYRVKIMAKLEEPGGIRKVLTTVEALGS